MHRLEHHSCPGEHQLASWDIFPEGRLLRQARVRRHLQQGANSPHLFHQVAR